MLTVLSYGLGQDSTALLLKCIFDDAFRAKYVTGELIVVHSDTKNEHDDSLEWLPKVRSLCSTWNIPFFHLTGDQGYHSKSWKDGLEAKYRRDHTIGMRKTRSCTDGLKIGPIYAFLNAHIGERYGFKTKIKQAL
ncbi:MAG: adenine nucleotide alpha hydrolase family protein, partial [Vulcanimicrobiaceae bacterium]